MLTFRIQKSEIPKFHNLLGSHSVKILFQAQTNHFGFLVKHPKSAIDISSISQTDGKLTESL